MSDTLTKEIIDYVMAHGDKSEGDKVNCESYLLLAILGDGRPLQATYNVFENYGRLTLEAQARRKDQFGFRLAVNYSPKKVCDKTDCEAVDIGFQCEDLFTHNSRYDGSPVVGTEKLQDEDHSDLECFILTYVHDCFKEENLRRLGERQ